jgi:Xaa-Pro aminopeptidase
MLAMNSTLLVGPSDWDAARMPKAEFVARAGAFWRDNPPASGAIVYGDRVNHAELAYLTNFTPKLEAALALIPRDGAPQLLVGGGVNMLPAARPLTFVEDLRPLRNVGNTVAKWSHEQGGGAPVLIGGGFMPYALHQEIAAALSGEMDDKTAELRRLMGRKSARELAAQRATCAALDAAVATMRAAQGAGADVTAAVLAGEQAANRRGAQEVRTLFSLDGGRTLRPFDTLVERAVDPLQVYVAVRKLGYWAEGFAVLTASPHPCAERAHAVLRSAVARMQAGEHCAELARSIAQEGLPLHPITTEVVGNAIGLALEEHPVISTGCDNAIEPGGVYSLRVGLSDPRGHAIVSAMVAVHDWGNEVLWFSPEPAR